MNLPPASLPHFWEYRAAPIWQAVDFISDLHLCPSMPRTLRAFGDYLADTPADAVFILGDLFEVWVGDDACSDDFERSCLSLLSEAASRKVLGFMAGNRDFLAGGEFIRRAGLLALPDPTVLIAFDQRLLLSHGDALCLEDETYQQFRAEVRSEAWQKQFLARPLSERRDIAQSIRRESQRRQRSADPTQYADADPACAVRWLHEAGARTLVHGHTHRPGGNELAPGYQREVLSDWDLDDAHPGPPRAEVLRLSWRGTQRIPLPLPQAGLPA
jgi:UDP-2,3-diacylglucosamine hydrolase